MCIKPQEMYYFSLADAIMQTLQEYFFHCVIIRTTYMGWRLGHCFSILVWDVVHNIWEGFERFQIRCEDSASQHHKFSTEVGLSLVVRKWHSKVIFCQAICRLRVFQVECGDSVDDTHVVYPVYRFVWHICRLVMCVFEKIKVVKNYWIGTWNPWRRRWWRRQKCNTQIGHFFIRQGAESENITAIQLLCKLLCGPCSAALFCGCGHCTCWNVWKEMEISLLYFTMKVSGNNSYS